MPAIATDAPVLSVVIITRNEEQHIGQCIESVLAATARVASCEIVLVDSHSDDHTVEIARAYPIRIIELSRGQRCCPAMGRYVGARLTQGQYVLFVDGDTTIEPAWLPTALSTLARRPELAGVAGREDQIYYRDDSVIGGKLDYFGNGDAEREAAQFGGNAVYRRVALEMVGSFNPYLRSYEEAELGARLRQAGWLLIRIPELMAYHHTPEPNRPEEYWRRLRAHLLTGQGQALRIAARQGLFWEHARQLNRLLLFIAWVALGVGGLLVSVALSVASPTLVWLGASVVLVFAFAMRSRSAIKPVRLIVDWAMCSVPLLWGLALPVADPRRFPLAEAIAADNRHLDRQAGGHRSPPAFASVPMAAMRAAAPPEGSIPR